MKVPVMSKFSFFVFVAILSLSTADFGTCRYDTDRCSCKMGAANQGLCWDTILGTTQCSQRPCRAGWTCACGGRTHVCSRGNRVANAPVHLEDAKKSVAECTTKTVPAVSSRQFSLGTVALYLSRPGMLANDCSNIAWWLDGELLGNRKTVPGMSESNVDQELSDRENHSLLEILPGSLVAFRVKEGSYYCFKHLVDMVINGTHVTSSSPGVTVHYAREYTKEWFLPSYKLTPDNTAEDESETDLTKFIPLRPKTLTSDKPIKEGVDYWEPRDDSSADNKRSNWYYRVQVPDPLPSPSPSPSP